jgi:chromate transporter
MAVAHNQRLRDLAQVFLKLGCLGFGGPAAHAGLMEDEIVRRRNWLTHDQFLDMMGACNLIPGPNSTELTMHVGYHHAGWRGLLVAGACFIVPAALLTGLLAAAYQHYGAMPEVVRWTRGIPAAILAIILGALWKLGKTAVKNRRHAVLGFCACLMALGGINEVMLIFVGGLVGMSWLRLSSVAAERTAKLGGVALAAEPPSFVTPESIGPVTPLDAIPAAAGGLAGMGLGAALAPSLAALFLVFLKCGALLFGSGYVLVAFLQTDLVDRTHWLTQTQLLDAIAAGQVTPGPLFTTATFVGYQLHGPLGALVATVGIFLPSFILVAVSLPLLPKLRGSPWTSAFLDAVNVISLGLMASALWRLGSGFVAHRELMGIALVAAGAIYRFPKLNLSWLVLAGGLAGGLLPTGL